jgi:D-glucosaminate-6-phosphate ammonia-lyase
LTAPANALGLPQNLPECSGAKEMSAEMGIYDKLGVVPLINACGTVTRLSGGMMAPEVSEAMRQASEASVDMVALQAAASRVISAATGAQAGIVTSGASAAVLLGAAACIAGLDPIRMNALPEIPDGRRDFIVVRSQRNMYDRALLVAGGRIVEVGIPDRVSGPGVRDAAAWEIAAAITKTTAGIYYLAEARSKPTLRAVAEVAREHALPLLVDAAGQLPPACNLRRFLDNGADLVCFSGGKAIGGPQASGILAGRADLVASALLQMLDLDVFDSFFAAPDEFSALRQMRGLPHHGIGRSCKVGKEEIAGLCVALTRFAAADPAARRAAWQARLHLIATASGRADMQIASGPIPILSLDAGSPEAAEAWARWLLAGPPPIAAGLGRLDDGLVTFNPVAMTDAQAQLVGARLRDLPSVPH